MPTTNTHPKIKSVPLEEIDIDDRYQRVRSAAMVKKIASNFDPVLCGALDISTGSNGRFAVIDGQHRLVALRLLGEKAWPCRIHTLTPQEQASSFVRMQTERRSVLPIERHKAAVFAGDDDALGVVAALGAEGYTLSDAREPGALRCAGAIYEAYKQDVPSLQLALEIIRDSWGQEDSFAMKAPMVRGMAFLVFKHGDDMDVTGFKRKLSGVPASKVIRGVRGEWGFSDSSSTAWMRTALYLLEIYNSGRRTHRISPKLLRADA